MFVVACVAVLFGLCRRVEANESRFVHFDDITHLSPSTALRRNGKTKANQRIVSINLNADDHRSRLTRRRLSPTLFPFLFDSSCSSVFYSFRFQLGRLST